TIDRERFPHSEGQHEVIEFQLPQDCSSVGVSIFNETGEEVLQKDMGPQSKGSVSFNWDGMKSNTLPAKNGNYYYRVKASNEHGQTVETNPRGQARVVGVSFEGQEPVFLVGDNRRQDRVTMKSIVRIDDV